jgi:YVTN family beta-propeller protein
MKRKLLLSLVISITVLLAGGSVMFFLSCAGEGDGGAPEVGTLYIGGYIPGDPPTGYIYVMGAGAKDLITTIEIPVAGAQPDWLTLSPDGKKLYCSDKDSISNRVYIIDTETNTYDKSTTVYNSPKGIAFTPDGTKALVGCNREVCLIDVETGSHNLSDWVSTLYQVAGIEVHPTNNMWYAALEKTAASYLGAIGYGDVELSSVSYVEDVTTEKLIDITLSSDGNKLYTSEWSQNRIVLGTIDLSGIPSTAGEGTSGDTEVWFEKIALAPDDSKLYISRMCKSRIDYLETANPSTTSTIDYGGLNNVTMDVALSDDGTTVFVLVKYLIGVDSIKGCRVVFINATEGTVAGTVDVGEFEPLSIVYKKP